MRPISYGRSLRDMDAGRKKLRHMDGRTEIDPQPGHRFVLVDRRSTEIGGRPWLSRVLGREKRMTAFRIQVVYAVSGVAKRMW